MSERPTKERILKAAEPLMLERGFHAVGLKEILQAVGVPKGSFYHHFGSKEQFGVELLKLYVSEASAYKRQILLSKEEEPNARLRLLGYLDPAIEGVVENGGKCPCLVMQLASEIANASDAMRDILAEGRRDWASIFEQVIQEGIDAGDIRELSIENASAILTYAN